MKKKFRQLTGLLLVMIFLVSSLSGCQTKDSKTSQDGGDSGQTQNDTGTSADTGKNEDVTLKFLMCWNGASGSGMTDSVDNLVAQKIKEATGVSIEIEYITTSEVERLNLMFASGNMPDIVNAPYWGGTNAETVAIKKAAKEGLLLDLKPLIEKYGENLKSALTTGIAVGYMENDVNDPEFEGKQYVLPQQAPATNEDVLNWGGGLYCRKDILDALNIDPASINSADALYDLMKKIKEGGFKDINGKDVIPSGAWGDGWDYVEFWRPFRQDSREEFDYIDGKFVYRANNPAVDDRVLYMRKLISEGLFDPECLRQSDTQGKEKMATGRVAIIGNHYFHISEFMSSTLYKTNPEMQYIAIGPLPWSDGKTTVVEMPDRNGTPVMFLPSTCKNPEAAIKVLNYINSDEGQLLAYYGVEGEQYEMVDGKPRMKQEWLDKYKANPKELQEMGIRSTFTDMICLDKRLSAYGELQPGDADSPDVWYEQAKSVRQIEFLSGYTIKDVTKNYPKKDEISSLIDWNAYRDATERAYFADSDEEALKILEEFRQQLRDGGITEYEEWVTQEMQKPEYADYIY